MARNTARVLVVDDDPRIREIVSETLQECGYLCLTATDGVEAAALVQRGVPDLVITDLSMPRMGGLEFITQLRRSSKSNVPVIIMSALRDFDRARAALQLNVSDYLLKPFESVATITAAVRRVLDDRKRLARQLVQQTATRSDAMGKTSRVIRGFEILEELGAGAMGTVFKARQVSSGRIVALKVLNVPNGVSKQHLARFQSEADVLTQLDHPNVVRGIESGHDGRYCYLVMEYVEGEPASKRLERDGAFPESEALYIASQVTNALAYIWGLKLIHRDIKPANILLTTSGLAKLADMGIAKFITDAAPALTATDQILGTPNYLSPEQIRASKKIDIRADIYSLGATLYHMVVGRPPFSGRSAIDILAKQVAQEPVLAHIRNPKVSTRTSSLIQKMMQKNSDARYTGPSQLLGDLNLVYHGLDPIHSKFVK